jgi:N utilization substance protein B
VCDSNTREVFNFNWVDRKIDAQALDFAKSLIEGTIGKLEFIDAKITTQLEHWDLNRVSYIDRAILRFSTYSLFFQDDVPDTVIINEAIDLAKMFGTNDSYRFINGVLDGIRKDKTLDRKKKDDH